MQRYLKSKRCRLRGKDLQRHLQVLEFMRFQRHGLQKTIWSKSRMELAYLVAAGAESGRRVALRIIHDERKWIQKRQIDSREQRKQAMLLSQLTDEGTLLAIREFIANAGDTVSSHSMAVAITKYWASCDTAVHAEKHVNSVSRVLKSRTAANWLNKLGYRYKEVKKGIYKDGHEREDVVTYRQEVFIPALEELKPFMVRWQVADNGILEMIVPDNLPPGQRPIILVTHDESTFDSNDGRRYAWMKEGEPPLRKKSRGKGIMVSDFVTPGGRLQAPDWMPVEALPDYGLTAGVNQRYSHHTATMHIEYGKDDWWTGDDLVMQVRQLAIPLFETVFPEYECLFLFDNATSHSAFTTDALRAKSMSLRPGGAQKKLRPGINSATGEVQLMVDENGIAKGLKKVLEERGLWRRGLRLQCRKPGSDKLLKSCLAGGSCCARAIIAAEPDFRAQKCRLQEEIEQLNHRVLFYPKFHCELNFIEYVWGAAKRFTRNNCGYSIKTLRQLIPDALESVDSKLIWKFSQRTERILNAYQQGIQYGSSEFTQAVKHTYRSHRRVSESQTIE